MSKFEYESFCGDYCCAFNAEKYTIEQAIEIFKKEYEYEMGNKKGQHSVSPVWVRHRAGIDEDGERQVGWWIEPCKKSTGCKAWGFSRNWKDMEG